MNPADIPRPAPATFEDSLLVAEPDDPEAADWTSATKHACAKQALVYEDWIHAHEIGSDLYAISMWIILIIQIIFLIIRIILLIIQIIIFKKTIDYTDYTLKKSKEEH